MQLACSYRQASGRQYLLASLPQVRVAHSPARCQLIRTAQSERLTLQLYCFAVFYYYTNLGLTNREAVALTGGGHSIGGADVEATGWNGTFT